MNWLKNQCLPNAHAVYYTPILAKKAIYNYLNSMESSLQHIVAIAPYFLH